MTSKTIIYFLVCFSFFNIASFVISNFLLLFNVHVKQRVDYYKFSTIVSLSTLILFILLSFLPDQFVQLKVIGSNLIQNKISFLIMSKTISKTWSSVALNVYLFILSINFLWFIISYLLLVIKLRKSLMITSHGHDVFLTDDDMGTFCFGIFMPKIYISKRLYYELSDHSLRTCIIHEYNHCKRNDPMWKVISLIINKVLFFSPPAYFFHRNFDLELEKYCDDETLIESGDTVHFYGNMLIDMATIKRSNYKFTLNIEGSTIKRRIVEMKSRKKTQRPVLNIFLCLVCLSLGVTTIFASSGIANQSSYNVIGKIFINNSEISTFELRLEENRKITMKIPEKELFVSIIARDEKIDGNQGEVIRLAFDVRYDSEDLMYHARPSILTISNSEAEVSINNNKNQELLKIELVTKRL